MWRVRDGGCCPQKEEHPYCYVCGGEERRPGDKEKGDINFDGKWTPHLALLSAQKATETIISVLHLRPLELGWWKSNVLFSVHSLWRTGASVEDHVTPESSHLGWIIAEIQLLWLILVFKVEQMKLQLSYKLLEFIYKKILWLVVDVIWNDCMWLK